MGTWAKRLCSETVRGGGLKPPRYFGRFVGKLAIGLNKAFMGRIR